jgi:hypothetical protein
VGRPGHRGLLHLDRRRSRIYRHGDHPDDYLPRPGGTISAAVTPLTPAPGQQATITISGTSEAPKHVFAKIRMAGGAPCAQTYDADAETDLQGQDVNGGFTLSPTTTQSTAGSYLVCLWLAGSGADLTPTAGPQPMTFTVAARSRLHHESPNRARLPNASERRSPMR